MGFFFFSEYLLGLFLALRQLWKTGTGSGGEVLICLNLCLHAFAYVIAYIINDLRPLFKRIFSGHRDFLSFVTRGSNHHPTISIHLSFHHCQKLTYHHHVDRSGS